MLAASKLGDSSSSTADIIPCSNDKYGECHIAILAFDSTVKVPAAFSTRSKSPLSTDKVADSRATHHFAKDRRVFKNLRRIDGNLRIQHLRGISDPVSFMGTVVLEVDGDKGKQMLKLHNVILKESLIFKNFSLQLAKKQGLQYDINIIQGEKIRLVNKLSDGSTQLFALMIEEAGRWTLDTTLTLKTPPTTFVLLKSGIDATETRHTCNRPSVFNFLSLHVSELS